MRIVAGTWRGTRLADLGKGDPAAHLRPTSDRVRESLFNLLTNGRGGDAVTGARVLDLFAGTGALGLEALSRGAAAASFVDNGRAALSLLRANIAKCGAGPRAEIFNRDATRLPENTGVAYDLVFLDPPYGQGMGETALAAALQGGWIAPAASVVWEEAAPPLVPSGLRQVDRRSYGGTTITVLRAEG